MGSTEKSPRIEPEIVGPEIFGPDMPGFEAPAFRTHTPYTPMSQTSKQQTSEPASHSPHPLEQVDGSDPARQENHARPTEAQLDPADNFNNNLNNNLDNSPQKRKRGRPRRKLSEDACKATVQEAVEVLRKLGIEELPKGARLLAMAALETAGVDPIHTRTVAAATLAASAQQNEAFVLEAAKMASIPIGQIGPSEPPRRGRPSGALNKRTVQLMADDALARVRRAIKSGELQPPRSH